MTIQYHIGNNDPKIDRGQPDQDNRTDENYLKRDGKAHEYDADVERDAVVGRQHGQQEGADDAAGDARDDDLGRTDQPRDEDAAQSAGDEGRIVEDVEQVGVRGGHLEWPAEGIGVGVALEEAFQAAGHDVVDVDEQQEWAPAQEFSHPSFTLSVVFFKALRPHSPQSLGKGALYLRKRIRENINNKNGITMTQG